MKSMYRYSVRSFSWFALACLLVLLVALAACGGETSSGSASSVASSSGKTVTIKESKGASGDVYMCDPSSISVKKGEQVTFLNQSDEIQDFDQGDAQKAGVDFKMNLNQSTTATFSTVGTFTIKSEKGATITVTVQE